MNNQQRNRVPIYRDLNALGIVKKELKSAYIISAGSLKQRPVLSRKGLLFLYEPL